jgi:hypothetical protein
LKKYTQRVSIRTNMNEFPVATPASRRPPISLILIILLGIGSIGFGMAAILLYNQAQTATNTLNKQKTAAAEAARADQKVIDASEALAANQSPYRTYTAPTEFGGFQIKFPKNWSSYVDHEVSAQLQVNLIMHPDFVRRDNGIDTLAAAKVQLIQRTGADYLGQYKSNKKITQTATKVSGVNAVAISGTFPDKRTVRQIVVPVRDKVIVFSTEASAYSKEFDEILAQSKIVP